MGFSCGIIGLPNAGKSTLLNALSAAGAQVASYPFTTIEPNVGVVPVPDERLQNLARIINPTKVTPTTLEFVDIAGLVKGASEGEGLGNQFLSHIRNVDVVAHVVRCFADPDVAHPYGIVDPLRDAQIVQTELILADLQVVERRLQKKERIARLGKEEAEAELQLLKIIKESLEKGERVATCLTEANSLPSDLLLLTAKPMLPLPYNKTNMSNNLKNSLRGKMPPLSSSRANWRPRLSS